MDFINLKKLIKHWLAQVFEIKYPIIRSFSLDYFNKKNHFFGKYFE